MTTKTLTLTEFLLTRIAEDELLARDVGADAMTGARWKSYPREAYEELQSETLAYCRRLLAECEAKRRIVELHRSVHECDGPNLVADPEVTDWSGGYGGPCDTLRALASVYADHPTYREEWRI